LRTTIGYDIRGRQDRTVSPDGSIDRVYYDGLDRILSQWIGAGSDDAVTGDWTPTNAGSMVDIIDFTYDDGGVGDGNLTKAIKHPGGGAADRRSDSFYDWRDRLVVQKDGVQTSESTGVNRPIQYFEYDNLSRVTAAEIYDGDNVTTTFTGGVPNKPSSSLRRERTETSYDEVGQVYKTERIGVNQSSGALSTITLATNFAYDRRGNQVWSQNPAGDRVTMVYDGAGRQVASIDVFGKTTTAVYDAASHRIASIDPLGNRTTFTYDLAGRPVETIDEYSKRTTVVYDVAGNVGTTIDRYGNRTTFTYDLAHRPLTSVDAFTQRTTSVYDTAGRLESTSNEFGDITTITYDPRGRTTAVEDFLGTASTAVYNDLDEVVAVGDRHGNLVTTTLDVVGRVSTVKDSFNSVTTTTYDRRETYWSPPIRWVRWKRPTISSIVPTTSRTAAWPSPASFTTLTTASSPTSIRSATAPP